jgi:hypothetical protein
MLLSWKDHISTPFWKVQFDEHQNLLWCTQVVQHEFEWLVTKC